MVNIPVSKIYKEKYGNPDPEWAESRLRNCHDALKFVRENIPEMSNWSDLEIIAFGDEYARVYWYMSGFQVGAINRQSWLDLATYIALHDTDLDDPNLFILGWLEEDLDPSLHGHIIGQYLKYAGQQKAKNTQI